jgi:Domain of unknown function (DUF4375)
MAKITDIDKLLESNNINASIIELDNFIGDACNYGDEMSQLTEPQKLFYLNQNLEREVNNGGFNQYFLNSSGDFAHETVLSLKTIGADITAQILQTAIDQFPEKYVPKNKDEREILLEKIEGLANKVWEELDQQFFEYKDNLNSLNIEYVRINKSFF